MRLNLEDVTLDGLVYLHRAGVINTKEARDVLLAEGELRRACHSDELAALVENKILSINDARRYLGLERCEHGDEGFEWAMDYFPSAGSSSHSCTKRPCHSRHNEKN